MKHTFRNNRIKIILSLLITIMLFSFRAKKNSLPEVEDVISIMRTVADYEFENTHLADNWQRFILNSWIPSSLYPGVMAMYRVSEDEKYLKYAKLWSEANKWQLAPRFRHADDHLCGSTYLEIYEIEGEEYMLSPTKNQFDSILAVNTLTGREDWSWSDALFMAPPTWARLGKITGDDKYFDFLNTQFFDAVIPVFDVEESLFYRDTKRIDKSTKNGSKVFWLRGNGWVAGGIPRIIDCLKPNDPYREKYEDLLKTLLTRVAELQGDDGFWRASLLDVEEFPMKESSGTAFFCYGMAWAINNGLLDREKFLPIVVKAWNGLCDVVDDEGRLCYVQPGAGGPKKFPERYTHAYAIGAFLLAGEQMIELIQN